VNVFGGITRCDEVASGLVDALAGRESAVPMIVRFVGTNDVEGYQRLSGMRHQRADTLLEAAELAVNLARGVTQ